MIFFDADFVTGQNILGWLFFWLIFSTLVRTGVVSLPSLDLVGSWETLQPPGLYVLLCKNTAGSEELEDIEELFQRHDKEADTGDDPRSSRVHLVCTNSLQGSRAEGIRENLFEDRGVDLRAGLEASTSVFDRFDKMRRKNWRRERQKVQSNEEKLV